MYEKDSSIMDDEEEIEGQEVKPYQCLDPAYNRVSHCWRASGAAAMNYESGIFHITHACCFQVQVQPVSPASMILLEFCDRLSQSLRLSNPFNFGRADTRSEVELRDGAPRIVAGAEKVGLFHFGGVWYRNPTSKLRAD